MAEPTNHAQPRDEAPRLSALVVARNEAGRIAPCLERLGFADEIVVLLDRSTDRTGEIARARGARVVEGAWGIEAERRNAGIDACTGDWILEVDADEWATPGLAAEIRAAIASARPGYFIVPMANHIGSHLVRHGWGAYNGVAAKPSLFAKGMKHWGRGRVHPQIVLEGERRLLREPLLHFVYRDIHDMLQRLDRYTDLAALDAVEAGNVPGLAASLRRMASRAWKSYVARGGYKEGAYGVALALYSALYPILVHLKAAIPAETPPR
ncbi:MAG TPA: glycosyltransferase family 2 protein [Stellaceae bacterium]|nr:glycosyltransferase family 2 protein [Stellaceae bacterium]